MQGFSDILGQHSAVNLLRRAVKERRPFHAYLFHGPESTGKGTAARAFARALMCLNPAPDGEACSQCPSCRKMESGNHPDYRVIGVRGANNAAGEAASWEISIDQIRQNPAKPRVTPPPMLNDACYAPVVGEWKVYVIDPADLLSLPAAGALLKLLEEPPRYVVIILITSRRGMILPTLRSRCWPVGFRLVPRKEIEKALLEQGAAPERTRIFAALCEGRIGWALANAQKEEIETARRKTIETLSRLMTMPPQQTIRFAETLREIALESLASAAESEEDEEAAGAPRLSGERALRVALPPVLDLAVCWFRDLLLVSQRAEAMAVNEDFRPLLAQQAANLAPRQIRTCLLAALETKRRIQRYANPTLAAEALAIRLKRAVS
jgi:DNA polymerase-3 subunit delta'